MIFKEKETLPASCKTWSLPLEILFFFRTKVILFLSVCYKESNEIIQ